jgi:hypothetical protein
LSLDKHLFIAKFNDVSNFYLEHEHSNDEKKLLSLLQESQEERDELLSQQLITHERIQKLEEQLKHFESDSAKMRDNVLCSKIKFEKKSDENERLINEFNEMKKQYDRLEQENQKYKIQIENERKKVKIKSIIKKFIFLFFCSG